MNKLRQSRWRALWVLPPLAIGVLVVIFMASGKQPPAKTEHGEAVQSVRVVEAVRVDLIHEAKSRGTAIIGIFHDVEARQQVCDREVDVTVYTPVAA